MVAMATLMELLGWRHYRQPILPPGSPRPSLRRRQHTGQSLAQRLVRPGQQQRRLAPLLGRPVRQAQPHQPTAWQSLHAGRTQPPPRQPHRLRALQVAHQYRIARPAERPGSCLQPWSMHRHHCCRSGPLQVQQMLRGLPKIHRLARLPMRRGSHAPQRQRPQLQRAPLEHRHEMPSHQHLAMRQACSWRCGRSRCSKGCSGCRLVEAPAFRLSGFAPSAFSGRPRPSRHPHIGAVGWALHRVGPQLERNR